MKPYYQNEGITIYHADCLPEMEKMEDGQYNLAIIDPPYGIKEDGYRENQTRSKLAKSKKYHNALWDQTKPNKEYFLELGRVSENQIVWGANHLADLFNVKSSCWIVWNKKIMSGKGNHFADCELAFGSFKTAVRSFEFEWQGMIQGNMKNKEKRIHPTQKPVELYKWLLQKYAKPVNTILDTHLGSGSIAIACLELGFELTAFEIDEDYLKDTVKRIKNYLKQPKLFKPIMKQEEQESIL